MEATVSTRGPVEGVTGEETDCQVYVEQESAFVRLTLQWGEGGGNEQHSVMLTPDLAESLSFMLSEEGKNARSFAS